MKRIVLSICLVAIAGACMASPMPNGDKSGSAQEEPAATPFDQADARVAVEELAAKLEENFIFPDAAKAYAAMLRGNLAAGAYDDFPDAESFAEKVTSDLQAVHADGHLRVRTRSVQAAGPKPTPTNVEERQGLVSSGWLAPGIAYVRFDGFPGNDVTLDATRAFVAAYGNAKILIIDARNNHGGGTDEMDVLFPAIFAEPTELVTMEMREAVAKANSDGSASPTMRRTEAPEGLRRWVHHVEAGRPALPIANAKVYLLISDTTFSAGEHLSLSLKRTHRATLVGEATGGGAHFGFGAPLGNGYRAFIPFGRTFDPDTGESWEGTGVAPDIAVPADEALDEVLRREGINISAADALAALDD